MLMIYNLDTYLIGHCHKNCKQEPVTYPHELLLHVRFGQCQKIPCELRQDWYRDHKIITVGLDEIVSRYTGRIYMMLAEWSQEILKVKRNFSNNSLRIRTNNRFQVLQIYLTFPRIGSSTDPQVSAAQWTKPEPKSAVMMPHKAAIAMELRFSSRNLISTKIEFTATRVMQIPTQMHSCVLFPIRKWYIICCLS